jgi:hypothetical protein
MTNFSELDSIYPVPTSELYRQWCLTRDRSMAPADWQHDTYEGWHLATHPLVHRCNLVAIDGTFLGWVLDPLAWLGHGGDHVPTTTVALPVRADAEIIDVERALYGRDARGTSDGTGLAGSWVAVVLHRHIRRVYLGASHSVMFAPEQRCVTTSHNLIPDVTRDQALSEAFDCMATQGYFPFGLTAFTGIHRLLPNHWLDLETFESNRHWPLSPPSPLPNSDAAVPAMLRYAQRLIAVIVTRYPRLQVFLSAGRDSRAVLAMLREHVRTGGDVLLATSYGSDIDSRTDRDAARALARIAGLPHTVNRRRSNPDVSTKAAHRGFVRIGEAVASRNLWSAQERIQPFTATTRFNIAGMGGETARAVYWDLATLPDRLSPIELVRRLRMPATARVHAAAESWLCGLPRGWRESPADALDLAYVEQRMGCWQAPQTYVYPGTDNPGGLGRLAASPMAETFCYEMMLRLPQGYRASRRLQEDLVAYAWPELLAVPFNMPGRLLRTEHWLRRAASPPRVLRAARRRLAQIRSRSSAP